MEMAHKTEALTALGHPGRMAVFRLLARRAPHGVRPSEIAAALGLKPNTLSVWLGTLAQAGLVTAERAGKSVFYRLSIDRVAELTDYLINDCCRSRPDIVPADRPNRLRREEDPMSDRIFNVLFICTGNSARSILAEALLTELGKGKFRAYSAGTKPYSEINPYALDLLRQMGHDTSAMRSKNVKEFQGPDAPRLDFVFTVCDQAANEECPVWEGQPLTAHWGMPDPVKAEGTPGEKALAFRDTYRTLRTRLTGFVALPIKSLDRISLQRRLDRIGEIKAESIA